MFSDERLAPTSLRESPTYRCSYSDQMKLTAASNKKGDFSGLNNVGVIWDNIRTKLAKKKKKKKGWDVL